MTSSKALAGTTRALTLAALVAAVGLSGCATINKLNVFNRGSGNKSVASKGERIPILGPDDQLQPAPALKGQGFFLPDPQPIASWPLPGGTPEQSVEHVAAGANLQIAWRRGLGVAGLNRKHYVTAPPIEAEGKVFAMDGQAGVSATDARSGARLWSVNLQPKDRRDRDGFGGGLAYAGGKVFVSSGYRFMAALDARSGRTLWRVKTDEPIHAAPTVSGGRVFAVSLDDQLLALDAATGQQAWTYQAIIEPARILASSSPAISGETIVTAFASGEVIAQLSSNGNDLWSQALSRANRSNALSEIRDVPGRPIIYKGDVFAASHSGLFSAIDMRTGQPRWSLPIASITTPWAAGDVVYVVSQTGQLICIARESGQIYWIQDLNFKRKKKDIAYWSGPILASGRLIVVSSKGELQARDPKTGAVQRTLRIGPPMMQPPIAAGDMLYLVDEKAELVAIR
jgi:outer membrane protein assembly factor BamB